MTRPGSRSILGWLTAAALLLCSPSGANAQSPATGGLEGVVRDSAGVGLSEVMLTATEIVSGSSRATETDRSGAFRFTFLPIGEYVLRVERLGYRPQLIRGVPTKPGSVAGVEVTLLTETDPARSPDEVAFAGATTTTLPGATRWVERLSMLWRAALEPQATALAARFSVTDDQLGVEGLPSSLSAVAVDGLLFRPAPHPRLYHSGMRSLSFPLEAASAAQLQTGHLDVEWTGVSGGVLSVFSTRASADLTSETAGDFGSSVIPGQSFAGDATADYTGWRGFARVSGPALAAQAHFSVGVEVRRHRTPISAAWAGTPEALATVQYGQTRGLNLGTYLRPEVLPNDAVNAFARLDWSVSERHQLDWTTQLSSIAHGVPSALGLVPRIEGTDILSGVSFRSVISAATANEAVIAFSRSSRDSDDAADLPLTSMVSEGLLLGAAAGGSVAEQNLRLSDAISFRQGAHTLKAGAALDVTTHRFEYPSSAAEYFFGGAQQLTAGEGVAVRARGAAGVADWTALVPSVFVQDRWRIAAGLEMVLGINARQDRLPSDRVRRDAEWFRLTGLANDSIDLDKLQISPRLGFSWDVNGDQRWLLNARAGLYYDRIDPVILAEWQIDNGTMVTTRTVGAVDWPPADGIEGVPLSRLTMLASGFEAPRSARISGGLSYGAATGTALHVATVLRRTEGLPRRSDLNLLPSPSAQDQYGRTLQGTLSKQGALLAAVPGSGRRFSTYDEVAAITADGWSDHRGLTIAVERNSAAFSLAAEYTLSKTTDNWFRGSRGGWTVSAPLGLDAGPEWTEGPSDFDVPHRGVIAATVRPLTIVQLSTLYRVQSGVPFTAGFRRGVDANADGSSENDVAFVDDALSGMSELVSEWDCLREAVGRTAGRNTCRGPATHALDLGIEIRMRPAGVTAALEIAIADVLATEQRHPDSALLLIPTGAQLSSAPGSRIITIPFEVNPEFGEPVAGRDAGRRVSLGLRLNW